ncbi:MAG: hypothetical protein HQK86_01795 [Nitrospinae bacterium]|nr:hypothetical protein [Nitrospinota bacterium]MBF0633834.1 hypothetical protein [Nitrospinota bacterium]
MSVKECVVCAWRAACNLKFQFESAELHCREFTRDATLPPEIGKDSLEKKTGDGKKPDKAAE